MICEVYLLKIRELLSKGKEILKNEGIESYSIDAHLLLEKVFNLDRMAIILKMEDEISEEKTKKFFKLIELRKNRVPVKYITNHSEFMGLDFYIEEGVLIPRPDTETVVEEAIEEIKNKSYINICDLCSGSGIIGITIASFLNSVKVDCLDISEKASKVTSENIKLHKLDERVKFIFSDLLKYPLENNKKYDIIVSNPPYIREDDIKDLMRDVRDYEPYEALCGGKDGLDFYRKIINQSKTVLNKNGMIIFEIGYDQKKEVTQLLVDQGFKDIICKKDLAGNDRMVRGTV